MGEALRKPMLGELTDYEPNAPTVGQSGRDDQHMAVERIAHARAGDLAALLTNLDLLPPTGAVLITPPLKIRQGSGSPVRVLALVEARR